MLSEVAVQMLAPLAPHMAEELWQYLGETPTLRMPHGPHLILAYLVEENVLYVVQVNGKGAWQVYLPKDASQEVLVATGPGRS